MEQIQPAYGISKETFTAIMMLYKNTKAMVNSLSGDTDFFDIVVEVLEGVILALYMFTLYLDYVRQYIS